MKAPHPFYISTSGQSQEIDARTIEEFGIDSFTLMETAGYSASQRLLEALPGPSTGVYLCGKGNNAGDALVVARYLVQHGHGARLVFLSGTDGLSEDTGRNYRLLQRIREHDEEAAPIEICESWDNFDPQTDCDFIVDGMLGTGLTSELRGDYTGAVAWTNRQKCPVYAIDIPTGLHGDTGRVMGDAVTADRTFSFGTLKQGFYLNEGPQHTGSVHYCELPFPNYLKDDIDTFLLDEAWVRAEAQEPARHKYEAGVLYVIAGSEGLTGAAMLAAQSAWAEGIGAVILVCPHGTLPIYEENLPQIIKKPVGGRDDHHFESGHLPKVLEILGEKKGKVLLGPGLGREAETVTFVQQLMQQYEGDLLIDADGLWCLARDKEWQKPSGAEWILTPHPGELSNLAGASPDDDHDRLQLVKDYAAENDVVLLSKGYPVIVGTPEGKTYLTAYDTRRFSRAGFGDILAGKVGAWWAMGYQADKSGALALLKGKQISEKLAGEHPDRPIEPKDFI